MRNHSTDVTSDQQHNRVLERKLLARSGGRRAATYVVSLLAGLTGYGYRMGPMVGA